MNYKVSHPTKIVNCEIDLPSSKSISNRLLIIQALCKQDFEIKNLSNSDDTNSLKNALNTTENTIDVGPAGTSFRFLTSYLATQKGKDFILTGTERMKERPIQNLVAALQMLGAKIDYLEKEGFPPLKIKGTTVLGGEITIDGSISSQFISSLLLIAPTLANGLILNISGHLVSKPYIQMTLKLMEEFGVNYCWEGNKIVVKQQDYIGKKYTIEADWSAATFWFEIASLSDVCNIKLNGLCQKSMQGDARAKIIFKNFGIASIFENNALTLTKNNNQKFPAAIDLIDTPDIYQSLKCTLFALNKTTEITGISTLKNKETDRIKAVKNELKKLCTSKIIETYQDHRMAMSFAPLSLKYEKLTIKNSEVVSKSYPDFWKDLSRSGFIIES
jgi:3-phosphoshikimate 1-carboxyvinyltransferase